MQIKDWTLLKISPEMNLGYQSGPFTDTSKGFSFFSESILVRIQPFQMEKSYDTGVCIVKFRRNLCDVTFM